jgi:hypothetical protein
VRPLEVVDLDLDAPGPGLLEASDELDADRAAVLLEPQLAQPLGAHKPEVAVDVPDRKPEQEPHRGGVHGADDAAVERVRSVALVPLDPVDLRSGVPREAHELGRVVLAVAVGVEDPVAPRGAEGGAQGPAVPPVARMLDDAQPRLPLGDLAQPEQRFVGRAVVDDDDLPLRPELVERFRGPLHEPRDRLGVVVTEQARRD